MLRRSGYPEKFRFEVISDSVRGYQKMVKREEEQPVEKNAISNEASEGEIKTLLK